MIIIELPSDYNFLPLPQEGAIEKRKTQQPQLFSDRLTGRHNKPTPQKYKHILNLNKPSKPQVSPFISKLVKYQS